MTNEKPAKFGAPIQLDLGGLGVRSMERAESLNAYLIVGGLPGEGAGSRLFRWSGDPGEVPEPVPGVDLTSLNPEAPFVEDQTATVLSDDGRRKFDVRAGLAPKVLKTFRGLKIPL